MPIPDKQHFKIGEVATLVGVKTSVLRYWETEFAQIRPAKSRSGQRVYERKHVERILAIKELLYERRLTIAGAKRVLRERASPPPAPPAPDRKILEKIEREVRELLQLCGE